MASAGTQYVPRTAATNFAFSYVQILLLLYVYGALFVQHLIPLTMPQNDPAPHWTSARSWRLMDMTSLHLQPGRSAAAVVHSSSCGAHRSCCAQRQLWCSAAAVVLMGAVVLIVDVVRMTAVGLSGSCCAHGSCCSQR